MENDWLEGLWDHGSYGTGIYIYPAKNNEKHCKFFKMKHYDNFCFAVIFLQDDEHCGDTKFCLLIIHASSKTSF